MAEKTFLLLLLLLRLLLLILILFFVPNVSTALRTYCAQEAVIALP
jgi:hypothetical protein